MPRVLRSAEAEEDLIEIWLDIAKDNPPAADRMLRHIDEKFVLLAGNPKLGRALPELREGMRRWPIGQYLILYREISGGVEIIRIVHGKRDLKRALQD
ncbi:MAG: type II toxin-antitoxin system RelE/ParE family toxin [Rhodomicrobium sp.]|jgi:toxin ParE1/3/4